MKAAIDGFTAWSNIRLVCSGCEADNILKELMEGERLKVLLQDIAGSAPKRLESLDGLTTAQKVIRVDWFVDALKNSDKLPQTMKVDSKMFSLHSADHIFPVLWHLACSDIYATWEIAPVFQKQSQLHVLVAEPLKLGPCNITKPTANVMPFYLTANSKSVVQPFRRRRQQYMDPARCLIQLVNGQLRMTTDGKKLHIEYAKMEGYCKRSKLEDLADLIDGRVLCALVNSLVPGTFTTDVLLNDRWTINMVLQTASDIFRVKSSVDSGDLYEDDEMGTCAFMAYFFMAGYQFCQAQAVVKKLEELKTQQEDLQNELKSFPESEKPTNQKKRVETKLAKTTEEVSWISCVYDCQECSAWVEHAKLVQAKVREKISRQMQQRFDVISVPRPMTINKLIESLVINLSLTRGNGFYLSGGKEPLWVGRKLVVRHKETGEFYDDFSGSENHKGSVREMLKLHPHEVEEVNTTNYPKYELFFESTSRNKTLKGGSRFLYQVFPGTTSQCQRLLLRAAKVGELGTVQKLALFFKEDKEFVNSRDHETGNTALHLASRHGHFETALHLLESGASVNVQNNAGCTPFFLSTEGLHKLLSQLLLEWGVDIHMKNKVSKTALELTRNSDLREFLTGKYAEYQELSSRVQGGDQHYLEQYLRTHVSQENPMASLRSRCVKGNTLFHMAASMGSTAAVEMLLAEHVDVNIINSSGATPLHMTRDRSIIQTLVEHGAHVDAGDSQGNTPLHMLCADKKKVDALTDCIATLVDSGASMDVKNDKGLLPIHCAASHGLISAIEALLSNGSGGSIRESLQQAGEEEGSPSLIYLTLMNDHLTCAKWLAEQGFPIRPGEADLLALRILNGPPPGCKQPMETFQFLQHHGADTNAVYSRGNRPLHLAASLLKVPEIIDLLLNDEVEVDAKNNSLSTPLFTACQTNNPYAASKLIANGADCGARDVSGKCPFDYIRDTEEWMDSGFFSEAVRARLKAFSLKHARDLVKSISQSVKTTRPKY